MIRRIKNLELGKYKSGTTHKNCLLPHKVSTNFRHRDGLSNKHEDIHKQISQKTYTHEGNTNDGNTIFILMKEILIFI